MVPYWLKPNKVGVVLFIVFVSLFPFVYGLSVIFIPSRWVWYLCITTLLFAVYAMSMISGSRIKKGRRTLSVILCLGLCCLFTYYAWICVFGASSNIGLPFGYYGEFNRVKWRLQGVNNIKILRYNQHRDLRLEDFWFTIQTDEGIKLTLAFFDHNKTYQLFNRSNGLAVQKPKGKNWILYPFGPDEHLETAIGKKTRNAVDVLENFERIAEVLESDLPKGLPVTEWKDVPKSYLWITYPAFFPQSNTSTKTKSSELPQQRPHIKSLSKDIEVSLTPKTPNGKHRLNWSPYGKRHTLIEAGNGLETKIYLGPKELSPILARLEKSNNSKNYDILKIDKNRNGSFEEDEILKTRPSIRRGKIWSSFSTIIDIPVTDPWTGKSVFNPYSISLWYVEDPKEESQEKLLRFTRRWWLEGKTRINHTDCLVLVSERKLDGIIDENDKWALADVNEQEAPYLIKNTQFITKHAWLGNNAYRITEIHPSGRKLTIEPYDPNITREEDLKLRDPYSEDREAARSGKTVTFLHDFKKAEALALKEKKPLFVDFEATWCGPCITMDELVYTADTVVKAAENVISVKVDGDKQPELKKQFKVGGYPTMILLTPEGEELKRTSGYCGVKEMAVFLNVKLSNK